MATGPRYYTPKAYALGSTGLTVPGGLLNFYLTGSSTRTPTFSNETLTVANANPVEADAAGVFPDIFLNPAISYKVVYTGPDDGITPPHEYWTADPVDEAWAVAEVIFFDQPMQFLGNAPPAASEIMAMYVAVRAQRIFGDFDGNSLGYAKAFGVVVTPPADGAQVVHVYLNGVSGTAVGTMTIAQTTGAFTFATTAGAAIDLDAGDYIAFVAPVTPDSVMADLSWTITGINL